MNHQDSAQFAASGFIRKVQETGQIPGCSFNVPVCMYRKHPVVDTKIYRSHQDIPLKNLKLLACRFSTSYTLFYLVCTICCELNYFVIFTHSREPGLISTGFQCTGLTPTRFPCVVPETSLSVTWIKRSHISGSVRDSKPPFGGTITTGRCLTHIRDATHSERTAWGALVYFLPLWGQKFVGVAHLTRGGRSCSWALYRFYF